MSTSSKIEWTDTTWNPLAGCTPVSPGCRNCYAANHARRLAGNPHPKIRQAYAGTARSTGDGRAVFTGKVNLLTDRLAQPIGWKKPRRVFVNAMSDLFHEDVPFEFVDQVVAVMALTPRHTYQVLTKRPARMSEYFERLTPDILLDAVMQEYGEDAYVWAGNWIDGWSNPQSVPQFAGPTDGSVRRWPLPNVWLGTSVEDQERANERVPALIRIPAAVRFLSCEPLLGPVYLDEWLLSAACTCRPVSECACMPGATHDLQWIIIGGESGNVARPMNVEWVRELLEQCLYGDVAAFVKQLGARPHNATGAYYELGDRRGGDWSEWPESLRVREFPEVVRG